VRIGLLSPLLERVPPERYGGTERVVGWLADELVALGHDVDLYASGDSRTSAHLIPLCEQALWKTELRDYGPVRAAAFARAYATAEVDVMHDHAEWAAYASARASRIPTVTTIHSRTDTPESRIVHDEFRDMRLVSVSVGQRRPLPRARWIANVPHGLPADLYRPGPRRGSYLAFVGRISPEKGVHTAIEVAKRSGLPLFIGGRKPLDIWQYPEAKIDRAYYEQLIAPHLGHDGIEFVGELDDAGKQQLLAGALALLFPIDWPEPFGLVLIEAMACGTPILARPRGSVIEIVRDGVTGYHCEDASEMVDAIGRLDAIDRAACRRAFEERFTATRMAHDYLRVYADVIQEAHSGTPAGLAVTLDREETAPI
jgi:glycosyltransferase involved in cell wall biosynthesis